MNQVKQISSLFFNLLSYLVLFSALFVYFGFFSNYTAYYQEKTTLFVFSRDYLIEHLNQPGSLLIYLSNLVSTFFYFPYAGSVLISVIICLTVFALSKIMSYLSGKNLVMIPFLSGAALFFFHTSYRYMLYNSIGLLLQIIFFYLTIRYLKGWLPVILFPVLYFITGSFAWIFLLMFSLNMAIRSFKKEWPKIVVLWFSALIIIYVLKEFILFQPVKILLTFPFSDSGTGFQSGLFLAFIGLNILLSLTGFIRIYPFKKFHIPGNIRNLLPSLILLILLITISILRFDGKTRQYFQVEKLFTENRFSEVVDFNRKNPSNNILTNYLNNIALCETGKLNDQLFHFRQSADGQTLFLKWEMSGEVLRRGGYFYYTIGMINEAQRWAYENMIMKGLTPEDLKMLIKTEIINGNYETASKYIFVLKKTLFYKKEALAYEKLLFNDKAVDSDPQIGLKRREKIQHDFFSITDDPYVNIERILSSDSLNRKAYEYKLAYMLLKKDYTGLEAQLKDLGKYGFSKIPVHLEEAAEAYKTLNLGPMVNQGTIRFDPATAQRFTQFLQTFQQYGNNLKSAEPALRQKFGNTFWYYAFYR